MLFLRDINKLSTTFCNSGTKEIILSNLNKRSSLRSNTDSVRLAGIKDPITIIKSKTVHPSEKKSLVVFSPRNLISISIKKNTVTAVSAISIRLYKAIFNEYVLIPIVNEDIICLLYTSPSPRD